MIKMIFKITFSWNKLLIFAEENGKLVEMFLLYSVGAFYIVSLYSMVMTKKLATKSIYLNCGSVLYNLGFLPLARHISRYTTPQE